MSLKYAQALINKQTGRGLTPYLDRDGGIAVCACPIQHLEPISRTNFSIVWSHTEIKHSDWLLNVTWLVLANQTALFQRSNTM